MGGSSPRAWGIHMARLRLRLEDRFIPTCVGNTKLPCSIGCCGTVHPHVRGEYASNLPPYYALAGSSPRAWGIPNTRPARLHTVRFIPTCVGNTCLRQGTGDGCSVHPHMRGEYPAHISARLFAYGSSPRAWGIPLWTAQAAACAWFIPTCVGNTLSTLPQFNWTTVHPHVRGEYLWVQVGKWDKPAVHPHVRGEYYFI